MKEGNESTCTGSLISPHLILTARHCIAGTLNRADEGGILCGYSTFLGKLFVHLTGDY